MFNTDIKKTMFVEYRLNITLPWMTGLAIVCWILCVPAYTLNKSNYLHMCYCNNGFVHFSSHTQLYFHRGVIWILCETVSTAVYRLYEKQHILAHRPYKKEYCTNPAQFGIICMILGNMNQSSKS